MKLSLFNSPTGVSQKKYAVAVKAADGDQPAEILVHGPIGRSFWSDNGITGKDFTDALNTIPKGQPVVVGVNSQGGSVGEGLAIYNAIQRRAEDVTVRIDGYALSIASFFPLAAHRVISPESAVWMIHRVWSWAEGNADIMRKSAEMLEKHDDVLVAEYVRRTGKDEKEIRKAMAEETWLTGAEAVEWGLADELGDNEPDLDALDFSGMEAKAFKRIPAHCRSLILAAAAKGEQKTKTPTDTKPVTGPAASISAPDPGAGNKPTRNNMKDKIIAVLKKLGIAFDPNASEEQLLALLEEKAGTAKVDDNKIIDINAKIQEGIDAATAKIQRRADAKSELDKLVAEKRITQAQADKALPAILAETGELKDSLVLAALRENPIRPEPAEPVAVEPSLSADASPIDTVKALSRFNEPIKAWQRGANVEMKTIAHASSERAIFFERHAKKILQVLAAGTNTIDTALKRDVILQVAIRDFAKRLIPLNAFSTVFMNVPLEGTNKVQVPFFDLDSGASTSFVAATGYVAGDTAVDNREIQIGMRAAADAANNTKPYDRKYQGLSFTSEELARQPFLKVMELAQLKAEKLASDIFTHVLSVVTAANYGAAAKAVAAASFVADDVADLVNSCKTWPLVGRSLFLDTAYHVALLKDEGFKSAMNAASDLAIKEGRLNPRVFGFDYYENPNIPSNGENLVGFAAFKSAILFAQAPVPPSEEVRNAGTSYSIVTDAQTGVSFEYRTFGDNQKDNALHFIEASYGFAPGNRNALKRITSQ